MDTRTRRGRRCLAHRADRPARRRPAAGRVREVGRPGAVDVNGDGWQDLFLGAQAPRNDASDPCNRDAAAPYNEQARIFVNRGAGAEGAWLGFRFGQEWNVSQPNTGNRLALPWDCNRDGRVDLLTGTWPARPAISAGTPAAGSSRWLAPVRSGCRS